MRRGKASRTTGLHDTRVRKQSDVLRPQNVFGGENVLQSILDTVPGC